MLTKGQKITMYVSAILAMIVGIITFIPFRTLPFFSTASNVDNIILTEIIIKVVAFPIIMIALSVYANILKYEEIADGLDRSKVVNVMSYFPIISYLIAIIVFIVHTIAYSPIPFGFNLWAVVIILLVLYLAFLAVAVHLLPNVVVRLDKIGTICLDAAIGVITICFALVAWRISVSYADMFGLEEGFVGKGDVFLFALYVLTVITMVVLCRQIYRMLKKDQRNMYINMQMFEAHYEEMVRREYNRAYNDIMDDFEIYFQEHYGDEFMEEVPAEEEAPAPEVVEAVKEEVKVEKVEEVVKAPVEAPKPKEPKPEKLLKPSYQAVVDFAGGIKNNDLKVVANDKGTQHKFYVGKKVFLITQKTGSDYRVTFIAEEKQALKLVVDYPGIVAKATTPKGEQWFKLVNKEELDEKFIQSVITKSYEALLPKPKPEPKTQKVFMPTYKEVVNFGSKMKDKEITVVANAKATQHKFYLGKKLFLVTQKTNNDYRVTFLSKKDDAIELVVDYPGVVTKATSPKGDEWFKITNKGELDRAFLKGLVTKSATTLEELLEEQKAAKALETKAKREAKAAEKAAEKASEKPAE